MLFEVTIAGAPGQFRLANYDQDIVFHGFNFLRFPIDVDTLEEATSASLVHLRMTVNNVDRQLQALLENYWQVDPDWSVTIWQIDTLQPDQTPYSSGERFTVLSATTDFIVATFDIQAEGMTLTTTLPRRRYTTTGGFPLLPRR